MGRNASCSASLVNLLLVDLQRISRATNLCNTSTFPWPHFSRTCLFQGAIYASNFRPYPLARLSLPLVSTGKFSLVTVTFLGLRMWIAPPFNRFDLEFVLTLAVHMQELGSRQLHVHEPGGLEWQQPSRLEKIDYHLFVPIKVSNGDYHPGSVIRK